MKMIGSLLFQEATQTLLQKLSSLHIRPSDSTWKRQIRRECRNSEGILVQTVKTVLHGGIKDNTVHFHCFVMQKYKITKK